MVNIPADPDPLDDEKKFVEDLIGHISMPCGTDAGNLREFYINEAQRALDTVQDPHHRDLLQDAITMGRRFLQIEKGNP